MPAILRPPRPSDLDRLVEIEEAAFSGDRLSRRSLRRLMAGESSFLVVAETDGRPAGYALVLMRKVSKTARLYSIAVDPAHKGMGLGALMLAAAEGEAISRGMSHMRLEVRADNGGAIALYRGMDYREIGRRAAYYEDGGEALSMEKLLVEGSPARNRPEAAR